MHVSKAKVAGQAFLSYFLTIFQLFFIRYFFYEDYFFQMMAQLNKIQSLVEQSDSLEMLLVDL